MMLRASLVLILAALPLPLSQAQGSGGGVAGDVWSRPFIQEKNQFGRDALPGCEVTFRSRSLERRVVTGKDGKYASELPSGIYSVAASCPKTATNWEYHPSQRADIEVKPGSTVQLNVMVVVKRIKRSSSVAVAQQEYRKGNWKHEYLATPRGTATPRRILVQYMTRFSSRALVEYHGRRDYRQDAPVSLTSDVIAIYADSIAIEKPRLHVHATGHVVIEDGTERRESDEATIEFDAPDPLRTLKLGR